jgi:hypothetical protein
MFTNRKSVAIASVILMVLFAYLGIHTHAAEALITAPSASADR